VLDAGRGCRGADAPRVRTAERPPRALQVGVDAEFAFGDGVHDVAVDGVVVLVVVAPPEGGERGLAESGVGVDPRGVRLDVGHDAEFVALGVDEYLAFVFAGERGHALGVVWGREIAGGPR